MTYDIVIVGGGPAGLTAAIYARRAEKSVLVLEKSTFGGQIVYSDCVENYPGFQKISGAELADNLLNQAKSLGAETEFAEATEIKPGKIKTVITPQKEYQAKKVILATGLTHRRLGAENEEQFIGRGVSFCAVCDGAFFKNRTVCVVGGGNTALSDALYLAKICEKVYLIHRREGFRADEKIIKQVKETENIELLLNKTVTAISGKHIVEEITLCDTQTKESMPLAVGGVFVAIGQVPHSDAFKNVIDLDERGYAITDDSLKGKEDGIFVAGDCRKKAVQQLTTAISDGTIAAVLACEEE